MKTSLIQQLDKGLGRPYLLPMTRIIEYLPAYQPQFYAINAAWIEAHYGLEDEDRRFLTDPQTHIIDKGGMIFFLLEGDEVAGTCGVMRMDDDTYELIRMSVDARFRGKGYGEALVKHAADWCRQRGATQLILETGSQLKTAIALYERMGFAHYTPAPEHRSGLARADVFMRMGLA